MPLAATCPHCRTAHRLADDLDGRLIRCKECREPFRVGGDRPGEDDYDDEPRPRRRRSRSSSSALIPLLVIGGVLGVGLLIIGAAGVWWLLSHKMPVPGVRGGGVTTRRLSPNAVVADHMIFPPRPAAQLNRPAELPEGPEAVTLTNLRRVEGIAPDRPTYQVDYQLPGGPPQQGREWNYLVVKVPAGIGETHLRFPDGKTQGTISFSFFPGHDPGQGFELWVEREPFGKPKERVRVSKAVALN